MKVHCYYLLVRYPQVTSPKNLSNASLNSQKKKKGTEICSVSCNYEKQSLKADSKSFLVSLCPLFYKVILVISAAWQISLKHRGTDQHSFWFCSWFSEWGILERQLGPLLVLFLMGLQYDVSWGFNHLKVSRGWMPKMAHTHGWQPMVAVDWRLSWVVDMSTYSWPR